MESTCFKDLLDAISQFSLICSTNNVESDCIKKLFQDVGDILMSLQPILENISTCGVAPEEDIQSLLEELNTIVNKARELAETWHQMISKVYFVLQFESVTTKLRTNLVETCSRIGAFFQSLEVHSGVEYVEKCTEKIRHLSDEKVSTIIRETIQDQMKSGVPASEKIAKIGEILSLSTNQELLVEIVALDKLKLEVDRDDNLVEVEYIDQMIALITHLHDFYVDRHLVHSINNVPVPADFCCPLSLELMTDPVIVASGQTYERAFIRKWLDQGFNVCPKTRQTLGHTNLIPNYTVKALIANWCETNDIKLPVSTRTMNLNQHDSNGSLYEQKKAVHPRSPRSKTILMNSSKPSHFGNGHALEDEEANKTASSSTLSLQACSLQVDDGSQTSADRGIISNIEVKASSVEKRDVLIIGQSSDNIDSRLLANVDVKEENESAFASSTLDNAGHFQGADGNSASTVVSDASYCSEDVSNELKRESPASSMSSRASESIPRLSDLRPRSQMIWRRASDRFSPRIISSSIDTRPDMSGVEADVQKWIEDLKSNSIEEQRNGATQLRLLARHSVHNRVVIASCGAITHLVNLLTSSDQKVQENAVTALLNLSIDDNNKIAIANADAIDPLIHVLKTGNPEAKANSAATFFSLSVNESNKARIGRSGAIVPLVDLLENGTPQGKRDAATALFNLSIFPENKSRIVQAGAVKHLVDLMDPSAGMVDKAVAVLSNLATIPEGRSAIGHENGIPVLVEVVELGSARAKEHAAAALLQLSTSSSRFCNMVLQEGAVPPLVALSQAGTPRGKEKAQTLLGYFRNQRHGTSRR